MRHRFPIILLAVVVALAAMPVLPGAAPADGAPLSSGSQTIELSSGSSSPALIVRTESRPAGTVILCRAFIAPAGSATAPIHGLCGRSAAADSDVLHTFADTSLYFLHCRLTI